MSIMVSYSPGRYDSSKIKTMGWPRCYKRQRQWTQRRVPVRVRGGTALRRSPSLPRPSDAYIGFMGAYIRCLIVEKLAARPGGGMNYSEYKVNLAENANNVLPCTSVPCMPY